MAEDRDLSARPRSDTTPRVREDSSNTTGRRLSSSSSSSTISIKTATALATMNTGIGTTRGTTKATVDNTMTAAMEGEAPLQAKTISRTTTIRAQLGPEGAGGRCQAGEGGQ